MIKKEDLKILETALGLKEGEFETLYKDAEEKPLPVANFEIISKADYTTRIANIEKTKYDEGKAAGTEITVKEIKKGLGLDVAKTTPLPELIPAIKEKIVADAKIPESEKLKELTTDLNTMKGQKAEWEGKYNGLVAETNKKENQRKITTTVINALPKFGDKPGDLLIAPDKVAMLALTDASEKGIVADIADDGNVIFKKADGNILKDANLNPMKADAVLKDYFQPYVRQTTGGGGGGDNSGKGGTNSLESFNKEMLAAGIAINSQKYNAEMTKRIGNKTLVI